MNTNKRVIYTIGFAGKSAEQFFGMLNDNGIKTLVDIRLNTQSQLSGFAKAKDLEFFLSKICRIRYHYYPPLAPSVEILTRYRNKEMSWQEYEQEYYELLKERSIGKLVKEAIKTWKFPVCFLCSEASSSCCHRRLATEEIAKVIPSIKAIIHL